VDDDEEDEDGGRLNVFLNFKIHSRVRMN